MFFFSELRRRKARFSRNMNGAWRFTIPDWLGRKLESGHRKLRSKPECRLESMDTANGYCHYSRLAGVETGNSKIEIMDSRLRGNDAEDRSPAEWECTTHPRCSGPPSSFVGHPLPRERAKESKSQPYPPTERAKEAKSQPSPLGRGCPATVFSSAVAGRVRGNFVRGKTKQVAH